MVCSFPLPLRTQKLGREADRTDTILLNSIKPDFYCVRVCVDCGTFRKLLFFLNIVGDSTLSKNESFSLEELFMSH